MRVRVGISGLLLTSLLWACDGGDSGDDGKTDAGPGADTGTGDSGTVDVTCDPNFGMATACGGDLQGTWNYNGACGPNPITSGLEDQCPQTTVTAERFENGMGTLTVSGQMFALDVTTDVHVEALVPGSCAGGLGCGAVEAGLRTALPGTTVTCPPMGADCDCTIDGPVSTVSMGTLTTNNGVATLDNGETYYYCVRGNGLLYREFGTGSDEPVYVLSK